MQFLDGASVLGTASVAGGVATFATSSLTSGSHSITASYGGDPTYSAATSAAISQAVKGTSSVVVTSSANPSVTGQAVTFTATVTPSAVTCSSQFPHAPPAIRTVPF